jgi:hypothetical protein
VSNRQNFGIARDVAVAASSFVGHEDTIVVLDEIDELEVRYALTVGPTARGKFVDRYDCRADC